MAINVERIVRLVAGSWGRREWDVTLASPTSFKAVWGAHFVCEVQASEDKWTFRLTGDGVDITISDQPLTGSRKIMSIVDILWL